MTMRRILSAAMAMLLVWAMPLSAMAQDWYLDDGDIGIDNINGQQTVSQGNSTTRVNDDAPVIKQRDPSTATDSSIGVITANGNSASFAIENINTTGSIDVSGSNATITVKGTNTITKTDSSGSGVHVTDGALTIQGDGTLNVSTSAEKNPYGFVGAAIGSNGREGMSGNITIQGDVTVNATAKGSDAAIGSGGAVSEGVTGTITITGNATVNARSEEGTVGSDGTTGTGAAIGSGVYNPMNGTIIIGGNAQVTATGYNGTGIGNGCNGEGTNGTITIQGNANVTTSRASGDSAIDAGYTLSGNATVCDANEIFRGTGDGAEITDVSTTEETVAPKALYRVVDAKGISTGYGSQLKDGVLTITVPRDYASFTGTLAGLKTMKGWGVKTIVFQTNGTTSTFDLEDLLAKATGTFALTHDGETVTFTLEEADVSELLK